MAARGSKALPGSQGHEISSREQAGAKNSLLLQTCCLLIAELSGLGCSREATFPGISQEGSRRQVFPRGAAGALSLGSEALCSGTLAQES